MDDARRPRGRHALGIGAGWNEREHEQHGIPFPSTPERIALFAQQVETIVHHWTDDEDVLPKPVQKPHPPLIVGGTARLSAARDSTTRASSQVATPPRSASR